MLSLDISERNSSRYDSFRDNMGNNQISFANKNKNIISAEVIPYFKDNSVQENDIDVTKSDKQNTKYEPDNMDNKKKSKNNKTINKKNIEKLIRQLLFELGEDPDREGLASTPKRISEMYSEIFAGYTLDSGLDISFSEETDLIIAKDIQFYSMCEHHMLPFYGKIHIAYIPSGKVFGISKLARLVEKYARRLQIQERLTISIADEIFNMGVKGVAVIAEGEHLCMRMRGVKNNSSITTSAYKGIIKEQNDIRQDVLSTMLR